MVAGLCHFVFSSFHPEITLNNFNPLIVLNGFDTIHLEPIIKWGEKPIIIMRYRFWLFLYQYRVCMHSIMAILGSFTYVNEHIFY